MTEIIFKKSTVREYFESLALALHVPPPRPFPWWMRWLLGTLGEIMSRSLRISNRKLKSVSGWTPAFPSVREGWPVVVDALPLGTVSSATRQLSRARAGRLRPGVTSGPRAR